MCLNVDLIRLLSQSIKILLVNNIIPCSYLYSINLIIFQKNSFLLFIKLGIRELYTAEKH